MSHDHILLHPHTFWVPLKCGGLPPDTFTFVSAAVGKKGKESSLGSRGKAKLDDLSLKRSKVLVELSGTARPSAQVEALAKEYQEALLVACPGVPGPATGAAVPGAGWDVDVLRRSFHFHWRDVASGTTVPVSHNDTLFELSSIIFALGTWNMVKAAATGKEGRSTGVGSTDASQMYKMLREAAGMFQVLHADVVPMMTGCSSVDLHQEMLQALVCTCLGDAQSLSLLRALLKGHGPPLVAGVARDTAELYAEALSHLRLLAISYGWDSGGRRRDSLSPFDVPQVDVGRWPGLVNKLGVYLKYRSSFHLVYALTHTALNLLSSQQGGQAVRCCEEADRQLRSCYSLASAYDQAPPYTSRADHEVLLRDLNQHVEKVSKECINDNNSLYFQKPPAELPPLADVRRVVDVAPYQLPRSSESLSSEEQEPWLEVVQWLGLLQGKKAPPGGSPGEEVGTLMMVRDQEHGDKEEVDNPPELAVVGSTGTPGGHTSVLGADGAKAGMPGVTESSAAGAQAAGPQGQDSKAAGTSPGGPGPSSAKVPSTSKTADEGGGAEGKEGGCNACRCMVVCLVYPLLLLVSVVGVLIWLVLLPFKLCCCCLPCACVAQLLWDVVEYIIKAPLRAALWASGKPWHPVNQSDEKPHDVENPK